MFTPVGGVMDWLASYRYHSNTKRLLTRETRLSMYVPTSYILTWRHPHAPICLPLVLKDVYKHLVRFCLRQCLKNQTRWFSVLEYWPLKT